MAASEGLTLSSAWLREQAIAAGFDACGFARAEPIPPEALTSWLRAGYGADLDWMERRLDERLDVTKVLPGARTVIALISNYWRSDEPSPIARYARGRDYHATLRDRIRAFRRSLRAAHPTVRDYASVDSGAVMEKVWAARAGLGYVGRNGCFITEAYGSWVLLAAFVIDADVDEVGQGPAADRCGTCNLCVSSCPTSAIVADAVVDARACLSYQTIENEAAVPEALRPALRDIAFGCDICQEVCPLNDAAVVAHERFAPRPVSALSVRELAALSVEQYQALVPGTPLARAQRDGLRRNAAYALGAARDESARAVLEALAADESPTVSDAARWALARLAT